MLKMGLPSCCATTVTELSPANDETLASPTQCCATANLESSKKLALDGDQRSCSSVESRRKACCPSSPTTKTCCSDASGVKRKQSDTSAPISKLGSPCASSNIPSRAPTAQHGASPEDKLVPGGQQSLTLAATDLEKGSAVEHAVIQVSGMTCTGCERKLQRVLTSIAGVSNFQTSLVLGRAEFDIAQGLSINDVVLLLERQTEFKCVVRQEGHMLEVLIPGPPPPAASGLGTAATASKEDSSPLPHNLGSPHYPSGVKDVKIMDSKGRQWKSGSAKDGLLQRLAVPMFAPKSPRYSARISYDPHVVGARDLLEKGFGAPLSLAPFSSNHATATNAEHLRETLLMTLLSALLTIPVLVMAWAPLPPHRIAYGSSSLVLATLVQIFIAGPFYPKAIKALLFSGMIEMDLLIVISTTTAYIYSVTAFAFETRGQPLSTGEFFETSTLLVTLIMCGRVASAYARRKAADSVSTQALQPSKALLSQDGVERLIDVREFQYGDLFKVLPDSVVPTDGTIVSGQTEIDEAMITGEAIPVPKLPGSHIVAGSVNGPSPILARLTKLPMDNTISMIANMVNEAKLSKPRIQDTADRVASYFVPCILVLTVVVFLIWIAVGIAVRDTSASVAVVTAITYALAALVVSCPCAIGLAVPMVMVIAVGVGAKHGVIFKSPGAVETARHTSHVVFDKTGTLTQGQFMVVEEVYREENRNKAVSIAKQLTASSKHPVSHALTTHLNSLDSLRKNAAQLETVSSVVGQGMRATLEGQSVMGGHPSYVDAVDDPDVQRLLSQGLTIFCLRHGSTLLAIFGLRDALRADTASVISTLQARGILVSIVSGDSSTAVNKLATELGIPLSHVKGQCTPQEKARYIASLSTTPTRSRKGGSIMFCGDGSNDAVALAQADIGVHMAGGTDLAKSAADVVLTYASLAGILALMDLSRASMRRVYLNFAWSFVYNVFAILLAAGAFVTARIPPAYAGLGELVSVLPVLAVAMQLQWTRFQ